MSSLSCLFPIPSPTRLIHTPNHPTYPPPPSPCLRKPIIMAPLRAAGKRYKGTVMREEKLTEMIEKKVAEALQACDGDDGMSSDGCRVAWDEVEEVSQAKADLRRKLAECDADPLQSFCDENPETDECRVYDD